MPQRTEPELAAPGASSPRWLLPGLRVLAVALGAVHTLAAVAQESMNADGISYLDMGDALVRGDWSTGLNSVWSPLYSLLLGLSLRLFEPPLAWEFPTVHLMGFGIYLVSLWGFEFLWRELARSMRSARDEPVVRFPGWAWLSLGYALFLTTSLHLIQLWSVTPDMLVSALVYACAGLLLRIAGGSRGPSLLLGFGALLGVSYWAKAVMLPMSIVFLIVAWALLGGLRRGTARVAIAALAFALVAGPLVALLSWHQGRFTIGEAGRITYLRYVNQVGYPYWQPSGTACGVPRHPPRRLLDDPPVWEFGSPVGGTYPLSYDASYWSEGVEPCLDPPSQLSMLVSNLGFYVDLLLREQGGFTAVLLVLGTVGWRGSARPSGRGGWSLVVVSLIGLGLYALVLAEGRYVGAWLLLLWGGLLSLVRLPDSATARRLLAASGATLLLFASLQLLAFHVGGAARVLGLGEGRGGGLEVAGRLGHPGPPAPRATGRRVAESLLELGVRPGDPVAHVGDSFNAFWARLLRVRIVAEITPARAFWDADPASQRRAIEAFRSADVRVVVGSQAPRSGLPRGWVAAGRDGHVALFLR